MGSLTAGLVAFVAGLGLAGATAFGIVQSQVHANTKTVSTSTVDYGTNK